MTPFRGGLLRGFILAHVLFCPVALVAFGHAAIALHSYASLFLCVAFALAWPWPCTCGGIPNDGREARTVALETVK